MMKLTLSLLMLIIKYQGNKGKYHTVQKASLFISGFFSLFFTGLLKAARLSRVERNLFVMFLFFWVVFFLTHYIWFLKKDKSKATLHYLEYKKYLLFFVGFIFASAFLFAL
jgi:hypothetical protein